MPILPEDRFGGCVLPKQTPLEKARGREPAGRPPATCRSRGSRRSSSDAGFRPFHTRPCAGSGGNALSPPPRGFPGVSRYRERRPPCGGNPYHGSPEKPGRRDPGSPPACSTHDRVSFLRSQDSPTPEPWDDSYRPKTSSRGSSLPDADVQTGSISSTGGRAHREAPFRGNRFSG